MTEYEMSNGPRRLDYVPNHDLVRAALAVALFLGLALTLTLAAARPGSPLGETATPPVDWHGNVAASGWSRQEPSLDR